MISKHSVFITGGTGYIGSHLIPELLLRGHDVRAIARVGSEHKLPLGCDSIRGNALDRSTYTNHIHPADTFIHLVGVSHPSPAKAEEFRRIDYVAATEAFAAAKERGNRQFIYLSVAHPAPTMKDYVRVRVECEALLSKTGMNANNSEAVVRPWTRALVAVSSFARLLCCKPAATDTRGRTEARPSDHKPDGSDTSAGSGEPTTGKSGARCTGNQARKCLSY